VINTITYLFISVSSLRYIPLHHHRNLFNGECCPYTDFYTKATVTALYPATDIREGPIEENDIGGTPSKHGGPGEA
jgi:hypothetical protein